MKYVLGCVLLFLASACDGTVFTESPIALDASVTDARIAGVWRLVDYAPKDEDELIRPVYMHLGSGENARVHDCVLVEHRKNGKLQVARLEFRMLQRGETRYAVAISDEPDEKFMLLRYRLDGPVARLEWLASEPIAQRVRDGTWPGEIKGSGEVKQVVVEGVPADLFEYLETPEGQTAFKPYAVFEKLP